MRSIVLAVFLVVVLAVSVADAQLVCRLRTDNPRPLNGKGHICVYDGVGDMKVDVCTTETYSFTVSANKALSCAVGNQKVDGWLTTKDSARVIVLANAKLVRAVPAKDMYKNIKCIGFYTSAVVNPSLDDVSIENLFQKLVNCQLSETIKGKAQDKIKAGVGLVAEFLGAAPSPYTIAASLIIKSVIALGSMAPDPKDNDYLKFLEMHYIVADIKVKCKTLNSVKVAKCLKDANKPVTQDGSFKFILIGCTGTPTKDSYLKVINDKKTVLVTHASFWSSSPLYRFCSGKKDEFLYTDVKIKANTPVCLETWERNTGKDEKVGSACVQSPRTNDNKVKLRTKAGEVTLMFQLNKI